MKIIETPPRAYSLRFVSGQGDQVGEDTFKIIKVLQVYDWDADAGEWCWMNVPFVEDT